MGWSHLSLEETQIIQKTEEYNRPLCFAYVDYEKAFDSVETWAVLQSLQRYTCNFSMSVRVQEHSTKAIPMQRGVIQGDVISPKLFTKALEDAFKLIEWKGYDININGEYIIHLRFARRYRAYGRIPGGPRYYAQ
ncbi:unnamed protein product [Euphydryas editha]|uniref:Reverse transcriptase domain-containing protein n=1 Tax=Euphydryas editha TaxID=104508 RepID=A0AAU9U430_EUPED|nr:unnamed protein product [Euphydryas editha]